VLRPLRPQVALPVKQISDMLREVVKKRKERVWLRNQSEGEFDDGKLVDGLAGDRLVYKRRGVAPGRAARGDTQGEEIKGRKRVQFVMDVSGRWGPYVY